MPTTYLVSLNATTTHPECERIRRTLVHLTEGQIAQRRATDQDVSDNELGVEVTCSDIGSMTLTVTLPADHDFCFPQAIKSLEQVAAVTTDDASEPPFMAPEAPVQGSKTDFTYGIAGLPPHGPSQSALLNLPEKIRHEIFTLVLESELEVRGLGGNVFGSGSGDRESAVWTNAVPGVLFVNQQVHREIMGARYQVFIRAFLRAPGDRDD